MSNQLAMYARLVPLMEYGCPECGRIFADQVKWRAHINDDHGYKDKQMADLKFKEVQRFYECQLCLKWVTKDVHSLGMMQYHYFCHRPYGQIYRCTICKSQFERRRELATHLKISHKKEVERLPTNIPSMHALGPELYIKKEPAEPKCDLLQKALHGINIETNIADTPITSRPATKPRQENHGKIFIKQERVSPEPQRLVPEPKKNKPNPIQMKKTTYDVDVKPVINHSNCDNNSDSNKASNVSTPVDVPFNFEDFITFLCPQCGNDFEEEAEWRKHVLNVHKLNNFNETNFQIRVDKKTCICLHCKEVQNTLDRAELLKHFFKHLAHPNYLKCKLCNERKQAKPKMLRHIKKKHSNALVSTPLIICKKCKGEFGDAECLDAHTPLCHEGVTLSSLMEHVLQRKAFLVERAKREGLSVSALLRQK